jgi:hypothetical protein
VSTGSPDGGSSELVSPEGGTDLACSPDGTRLMFTQDRAIRVLDLSQRPYVEDTVVEAPPGTAEGAWPGCRSSVNHAHMEAAHLAWESRVD